MMKTPPIKWYGHGKYPNGHVTQWFGENPALYQANVCIVGLPCHPSMTCPVGRGCLIAHNGIDIVAPWGTPIYAVEDGLVVEAKNDPGGYGMHVRILSLPNGRVKGAEWTYGHNSRNHVRVGDYVNAGDHIADMGNTGFVVSGATPYWQYNPYAGTHLHLGKRVVKYEENGWRYTQNSPPVVVLNYDNGYFGSVDFADELKKATKGEMQREINSTWLLVGSLKNDIFNLFRKS
jgi:murein DD-endopeptidase MepM/ murein hydrolase activator NlpD